MNILGIETSCDETAAAVVQDGWKVLSNTIYSSVKLHEKTGGVVPEVAARDSALKIAPVIEKTLTDSHCSWNDIDAIAVTNGPGLLGSLLVGIEAAKALAFIHKKPILPVFHIAGHLFSNILERTEDFQFPLISLTVSGGHNDLYLWKENFKFQKLGETIDDAAGEAVDKGARMLGFSYPGGPALAKLGDEGNPDFIKFPHPMEKSGDYKFSFSGLKTALVYELRDRGGVEKMSNDEQRDICASYQEAIVDTLISKLFHAIDEFGAKEVHLAGGVSANLRLREKFFEEAKKRNLKTRIPEKMSYCTDNAAMIAAAGFGMWKNTDDKEKFTIENIEVNLSHQFRF